jgi:hypothetical protein
MHRLTSSISFSPTKNQVFTRWDCIAAGQNIVTFATGGPRIRGEAVYMKPSANPAIQGIKHILEFSADAHIQRRAVAKDFPAFHSLTGKIAAFGKVLTFLAPHEPGKKVLSKGPGAFPSSHGTSELENRGA